MKTILHFLLLPFNYLMLKLNRVQINRFRIFGAVIILNKGKFIIDDNVKINSSSFANVIGGNTRTSFVVKKGGIINIGKNVRISNSAFYCQTEITIGDNVMIGGSCKIWDSDFHPIDPLIRKSTPNEHFISRPIRIHESAFIGGSSIILKGVTIGKNAIIAAGSVVSRNVPDNEIWGGNPIQFIKKLEVNV